MVLLVGELGVDGGEGLLNGERNLVFAGGDSMLGLDETGESGRGKANGG
jgi:hypothetical protein